MNHYDRDDVLALCSRSQRLASSLARKIGMPSLEIESAEEGLRLMADKVSQALCDRAIYTVSMARVARDNTIEHENILTTPLAWEALRLRDDMNRDSPVFGARKIAQVIHREVMPRRWELWAQVSDGDVHLRCQLTNARALLRAATPEVLARLYRGKTLIEDSSISLQSERVEVTINYGSTRCVNLTQGGGQIVTHEVKMCPPVTGHLDINDSEEMTLDTHAGAVARFPITDGILMLPDSLAKALRLYGIVLPVRNCGNGKIEVRLVHLELLTRLELSLLRADSLSARLAPKWTGCSPRLMAA